MIAISKRRRFGTRPATGGVAERFIAASEEAIRGVGREPRQYRERFENVRRANLAGFPYGVFYLVQGETVYVLAVLHAARDHGAALDRRPPASDE